MNTKKLFYKIYHYLSDVDFRFSINEKYGFYDNWDDERFIRAKFKASLGYELNLDEPRTFNEKLNWLKLYDRKPEYTMMVDKYKVREYVTEKIGAQHVVPLLGVWDDPDEIDFDALPEQFVLKCNHNSGAGMCICKDKSKLDIEAVKAELRRGMAENHYKKAREWAYKDVERKIIAEKFLSDGTDEPLTDYKLLCFNGEVKLIEVHYNGGRNKDCYDADWNLTEIVQFVEPPMGLKIEKPDFMDEMLALTAILAKDIPHVRVDWYCVNGQIYFGELTFYNWSGLGTYLPGQDEIIGSWLTLPEK